MKKAVIIILSLICLIVCSCEKTLHQRQLVGSWAVTQKTTTSGALEGENTVDGFVYTFDKEGHGTIVRNDRVSSFPINAKRIVSRLFWMERLRQKHTALMS